jgi:uncharacterized membrane protein YraQ (UPF0718 family)
MLILTVITIFAIAFSFFADKQKTFDGILKGLKMFMNLLPSILILLAGVSIMLYFLPNEIIIKYLGENAKASGYIIAATVGSLALIPGFIAYPLSGVLVQNGVGYPVIAIFITTLMMVGILTLPIEIKFFGVKTALLRNLLFLAGALTIGLLTGLIYQL